MFKLSLHTIIITLAVLLVLLAVYSHKTVTTVITNVVSKVTQAPKNDSVVKVDLSVQPIDKPIDASMNLVGDMSPATATTVPRSQVAPVVIEQDILPPMETAPQDQILNGTAAALVYPEKEDSVDLPPMKDTTFTKFPLDGRVGRYLETVEQDPKGIQKAPVVKAMEPTARVVDFNIKLDHELIPELYENTNKDITDKRRVTLNYDQTDSYTKESSFGFLFDTKA
jgi:hypothetical protein